MRSSEIKAIRQRLWNPPNAVEDTGITMRNGWPVTSATEFSPRLTERFIAQIIFLDPKDREPFLDPDDRKPRVTVQRIIEAISLTWGIPVREFSSERRTQPLALARQAAIAITRRLLPLSLPRIGRHFGHRDHTTILHAVRKMQRHIDALDSVMEEGATPLDWARGVHAILQARQGAAP